MILFRSNTHIYPNKPEGRAYNEDLLIFFFLYLVFK